MRVRSWLVMLMAAVVLSGLAGCDDTTVASGYTTFFSDTFNRADGAIGSGYLTDIPGGSSMSIAGNQLAMDGSSGSPLAIYNQVVPGTAQRAQVDMSFTGTFDSNGGNFLILRTDLSVSSQNLYACRLRYETATASAVLALSRFVASVLTETAGTTEHPVGGAAAYQLRITADGSSLTCELLTAGGSVLETLSATDAALTGGGAGLWGGDQNGTLRYDNFEVSYR